MALKDLKVPTYTVKVADENFVVRGLSFNDIVQLVDANRDQIEPLFRRFVSESAAVEQIDIGMDLIRYAPAAAAHAIVLAADEPDMLAVATTLPVDVQIDALENIARLTVQTVGGPKKLAETVARIARGLKGTMTSLS